LAALSEQAPLKLMVTAMPLTRPAGAGCVGAVVLRAVAAAAGVGPVKRFEAPGLMSCAKLGGFHADLQLLGCTAACIRPRGSTWSGHNRWRPGWRRLHGQRRRRRPGPGRRTCVLAARLLSAGGGGGRGGGGGQLCH
jgi:hypothetical protein